MTSRKKHPEIAVAFTAPELETIGDLLDNAASQIVEDDKEAKAIKGRLVSAARKIAAVGPLREKMFLPGRFGDRAARDEGGAA